MTALRKSDAQLVETDIDGERVVMSLVSGEFFALKDTGLAIWRLLDELADRDELLEALQEAHDVGPEVLACDLDAFLAQLLDAGLLERV